MTVENVVKMRFGSSPITRAGETGKIISLAEDLKAAATYSLKKCATMLGVGLHLYNGDRSLHDRTRQDRSGNNTLDRRTTSGKETGTSVVMVATGILPESPTSRLTISSILART